MLKLETKKRYLFNIGWITHNLSSKDSFLGRKIWRKFNELSLRPLPENKRKVIAVNTIQVSDLEIEGTKAIKKAIKGKYPLVIKGGAKDWKCCQTWSPKEFIERFKDETISLIAFNEEVKDIKFSEMIHDIESENPKYYSRFNTLLQRRPELIKETNHGWLKSMMNLDGGRSTFQLFIGGKNTRTNLHAATNPNIFVQVYGQKRWIVYPPKDTYKIKPVLNKAPYFFTDFNPEEPDFETYKELAHTDYYDFTLEAGDIMYLPPGWWHHVINPTASIGFGFRWFSFSNARKNSVTQLLATLTASNPSVFEAIKHKEDFTQIFRRTKT